MLQHTLTSKTFRSLHRSANWLVPDLLDFSDLNFYTEPRKDLASRERNHGPTLVSLPDRCISYEAAERVVW